MECRLFCFLFALQMVSWAYATSRPFPPNDGLGVHQLATGQIPHPVQASSAPKLSFKERVQSSKSMRKAAAISEEEANVEGEGRIGSSPPSCDNKCYGCTPCEAIQVPTTQYTNYEPEGWKCKCGPSFYSP